MEMQTPEYWLRLGAELAAQATQKAVEGGVAAALAALGYRPVGGPPAAIGAAPAAGPAEAERPVTACAPPSAGENHADASQTDIAPRTAPGAHEGQGEPPAAPATAPQSSPEAGVETAASRSDATAAIDAGGAALLSSHQATALVASLSLEALPVVRAMVVAGAGASRSEVHAQLGREVDWMQTHALLDRELKKMGIRGGRAAVFPSRGSGKDQRWLPLPDTLSNIADALTDFVKTRVSAGAPRAWIDRSSNKLVHAATAQEPSPTTAAPARASPAASSAPSKSAAAPKDAGKPAPQRPNAGDPANATGAEPISDEQALRTVELLPVDVLEDLAALLHAGAGATREAINAALGAPFKAAAFGRAMDQALQAAGVNAGFAGVFPESGDGRIRMTRWRALPSTIERLGRGLSARVGASVSVGAPRAWPEGKSGRWFHAAHDKHLPDRAPRLPDLAPAQTTGSSDREQGGKPAHARVARDTGDESAAGGAAELTSRAAEELVSALPMDLLPELEALVRAGNGARRDLINLTLGRKLQWARLARAVDEALAGHFDQAPFSLLFPASGDGAATRLLSVPATLIVLAAALEAKLGRPVSPGAVRAWRHAKSGRVVCAPADDAAAPASVASEAPPHGARLAESHAPRGVAGAPSADIDNDPPPTMLDLRPGRYYRIADGE